MAYSAAGDELDAKRTQREINQKQKEYNKFCADNGLSAKPEKTRVEGYKRISMNNRILTKVNNTDIINPYKGGSLNIENDGFISNKTVSDIQNATKNIIRDMPILEKCSEPIKFGKLSDSIAENVFSPITGKNQIILNQIYFSDVNSLFLKLNTDYKDGISYKTSKIESLVAHEMGHNAHVALALKRAGVHYGKPLSLIEQNIFNQEYNKILREIYIIAFNDETYDQIQEACIRELGLMTKDRPRELIAQSFGNYYYGDNKSDIGEKIVKYFKKELK